MPEEKKDIFRLDDEQAKRFVRWLESKWGRESHCPHCRASEWSLEPHIISLRITNPKKPGDLYVGSPTYPCIPVVCNNCGYTALVNALMSNVLTGGEQDEEKEGKDNV